MEGYYKYLLKPIKGTQRTATKNDRRSIIVAIDKLTRNFERACFAKYKTQSNAIFSIVKFAGDERRQDVRHKILASTKFIRWQQRQDGKHFAYLDTPRSRNGVVTARHHLFPAEISSSRKKQARGSVETGGYSQQLHDDPTKCCWFSV